MVRNGTRRHLVDRRDHSFHRTFPKFAGISPAVLPLMEYSYDPRLTMPNQGIAEPPLTDKPYPVGCTGFATTGVCSNEDKVIYQPGYTYELTCLLEGHDQRYGCDMRTAMKCPTVYGLKKPGETAQIAETRKRGKYFNVDKAPGFDWFDSMRIALRANAQRHTGISVGTIWFGEWGFGQVGQDGILTASFIYNNKPEQNAWHNYVISGEKTINGEPYLEVKSWQGKEYGAAGWVYMSRETFNKAFDIYGTIALMPGFAVQAKDIKYVKLTLLQTAVDFVNRMIKLLSVGYVPNTVSNYA